MAQTTAPDAGNAEQNIKTTVVNQLRANDLACLVIEQDIQGEVVPTVYTAVEGEFARIKEASSTPSKVKRFTLCQELDDARNRGDDVSIVAQPQLEMDIASKVERLTDDEQTATETRSPNPHSKDKYDLVKDSEPALTNAGAPIDNSDVHGGGW